MYVRSLMHLSPESTSTVRQQLAAVSKQLASKLLDI